MTKSVLRPEETQEQRQDRTQEKVVGEDAHYFVEGGEMGALMRAIDWSQTPLGSVEQWPQSLRAAASISLGSNLPIMILWGPQLVMLYNDSYRRILGDARHPQAMGQPVAECWSEIWPTLGPMLEESVMRQGEAVRLNDQCLLLERNGSLAECYFTFSYSPIRDERGEIGGIFCVATETSAQIVEVAQTVKADGDGDSPLYARHERDSNSEDLHVDNEFIQRIFDNLNDHFVTYDREWRYTQVNRAATEMLGLSKEQLIGHCIWDLFPGAVGNQYYHHLQRAMNEGIDSTFEHYYKPWDRWIENRIYAVPDGVSVLSVDVTARKKAEEAQRQSEARLQFALQAYQMVAWEWDIQSNIITTSDNFADVYGQPSFEAAKAGVTAVHPDDRTAHEAKLQHAIATHSEYHSEYRIIRTDNGQLRWIEERGIPVANAEGVVDKLFGVAVDITERHRFEEALRESEARFRTMADNAPVKIWMTDADGRCIYLNQKWYEFTGQTPETGLGSGWLDAVHPDDVDAAAQSCLLAVQTHQPFQTEYRFRRHDGVYRWAIDSASPRFDHNGEYLGCIGSVLDITERKEAEDRLQVLYQLGEAVNRAEAVEQIYELALFGLECILHVDRASVLLFDAEGIMRFHAWRGLSDAYRQGVDGHSPWSVDDLDPLPILISDIAHQADLGPLQQVISEEGIQSLAFIPLVEQGKILGKFMLYYNQPHIFSEAEVQWAQTIARHVAHALQRKQVEEKLRQSNETLEQRVEERTVELQRSNRELDQFAYISSHDLKAPLRGINLLATWIEQDAADVLPESSKEHLRKLQGRIQRMDTLLTDLLAYSRAARQRHPAEEVEIKGLIQNVVEVLAPPSEFVVNVIGEVTVVCVERIPLETVIRNLIGNAIKHHDRPLEGEVNITFHAQKIQKKWIEFTVSDNGPGIDPDFHQRVFEMFQTLLPRDQMEGSGVGLAIVKKLVENRGGTLRIESSLGTGATFHFTWPHVDAPTKTGL